ncbi:MAG TPA: OsmC family protein [Firmicutes bacterium]|nr:OsmC family protein [Bacillota bacterium]
MAFTAVSARSQNQVTMDSSAQHGGEGSGVSPMEMVLAALAGCSGMDVVSILNKKRVAYSGISISVEGERADEHPRVFTKINVVYTFTGENLEDKRKALEDSVRLSMEKYCSVAGMVDKTAEINWRVEIAD